jgi:allantoinase
MFTVRSSRVVLPGGETRASIHIEDGRIARIDSFDEEDRTEAFVDGSDEVIDVGDLVVSPGIVDTHVHINEPGRTEWEGFDTGTRAAAAGGVTTIVDMPLNSIPATTTVAALEAKRAAARGKCHVDVAFWGGVVPGNEEELDGLVDAGVRGFKCFLAPSGVDEFPAVDERDLRRAMPALARRRVPLLVHAELPVRLRPWPEPSQPTSPTYSAYLRTRPPEAEADAIGLMVRLAEEFGVRTHIVHVAASQGVREIERAKRRGIPITGETCPHYLTFAADAIPDGATEFKCAPPIRSADHREALWKGLHRGVLDLVATDHSPAPVTLKCRGDFMRGWGGIASLELALSAMWTNLIERYPPRLDSREGPVLPKLLLALWLCTGPASLAGFSDQKGRIAPGFDADLVVWDPDAEFTVDAAALQQRHKVTPYAGRRLRGRVVSTFVRGQRIWDSGTLTCGAVGRFL